MKIWLTRNPQIFSTINTILPTSSLSFITSPPTMSFLLSLTSLFTFMLTFCTKTLHSFFAPPNSKTNGTLEFPHHSATIKSPAATACALNFLTFSGDVQQPTNLLTAKNGDRGGLGFLDDVGGSVNGLTSCTESLGFESSDERRADDEIGTANFEELCTRESPKQRRRRTAAKREVKKFPPPLSSLSQHGRPTFFLRPVRRDGRLELTEVKIQRSEILRASRQDGRLRLHFINKEDEETEEEAVEKEQVREGEEEEKIEVDKEEVEVGGGERLFPVKNGGGDWSRRCHEQVSRRRHHHSLHVWRQHCVTIS